MPIKSRENSSNHKSYKLFAEAAGIALAAYILYVQMFMGFIQFGLSTTDTGDGSSYASILDTQEVREPMSSIFKISEDELLTRIRITNERPRYLSFNVNYMDVDAVTTRISFQTNGMELAQDRYTFSQGVNYYKIPDIGAFDGIDVYVTNKQNISLGMNGISTLSSLKMNKTGLAISFLCFIFVLFSRKIFGIIRRSELLNLLKSLKEEFYSFIKKQKNQVFGLICVTILGYGYFCTNFTLSLDEELFWMIKDGSTWVGYGRFGNYFLDKYLTFDSIVVPFFTDVLAVVTLFLSSLIYAFAYFREVANVNKKNFQFIIFGGLFLTFPFVNGDFMAFSVYNLWISLGYLLTAISIVIWRINLAHAKKINSFVVISLLTFAISIYQSFISVFTVMFLILELQKVIVNGGRIVIKNWISAAFVLTTSTGIYLVLNALAQSLITPAYGYISMFVGWNKGIGFVETLRTILRSIRGIYLGTFAPSGRILTLSIGIFVIFIASLLISQRRLPQKMRILFVATLFVLAPFVTVLALGSMLPARSLSGLPLLLGGIWLVVLNAMDKGAIEKVLVFIGTILMCFQLQFLNVLFYGDFLRYQDDIYTGRQIIHQIEAEGINYHSHPIVFLGSKQIDSTKLISKINSGGRSFFDDSSQPYRMSYFLRTLGFEVLMPSASDTKKAIEFQPIQSWPLEGSVVFRENVIIVKLSN